MSQGGLSGQVKNEIKRPRGRSKKSSTPSPSLQISNQSPQIPQESDFFQTKPKKVIQKRFLPIQLPKTNIKAQQKPEVLQEHSPEQIVKKPEVSKQLPSTKNLGIDFQLPGMILLPPQQSQICYCKLGQCQTDFCICKSIRGRCISKCQCRQCFKLKKYEHLLQSKDAENSIKKSKKLSGCKCTKTQCVKKYCACFRYNNYCDSSCQCQGDCLNRGENEQIVDQFKIQEGQIQYSSFYSSQEESEDYDEMDEQQNS